MLISISRSSSALVSCRAVSSNADWKQLMMIHCNSKQRSDVLTDASSHPLSSPRFTTYTLTHSPGDVIMTHCSRRRGTRLLHFKRRTHACLQRHDTDGARAARRDRFDFSFRGWTHKTKRESDYFTPLQSCCRSNTRKAQCKLLLSSSTLILLLSLFK